LTAYTGKIQNAHKIAAGNWKKTDDLRALDTHGKEILII
jgi:hypothetical protein